MKPVGDNPVLELKDLCVDLDAQRILSGVNLQIHSGELVGLVGPNGAGKTTLLRAIMGLVPVISGTISLEKRPGYVPQYHAIDWSYPISVEQTVMTSLHLQHHRFRVNQTERWHQVYRALEQVKMLDYRRVPLGQLSGGQKQRVLIARTLATSPQVLLLDEPFTGLDYPTQEDLTGLFADLTCQGVSIFMSTHDLVQAVDISDELVLLNRKVMASGRPQELLDCALWAQTFQVSPDSALLRSLGLITNFSSENAVEGQIEAGMLVGEESSREYLKYCKAAG